MTRAEALEEARLVIQGQPSSYVGAAQKLAHAMLEAQQEIDFLRGAIDLHRSLELSLIATIHRLDPVAASPKPDGSDAEAR